MTTNNRIDPMGMTLTIPRQTPRTEFGTVLAGTLGSAMQSGLGVMGSIAGFNPVATMAVSTLNAATRGNAAGVSAGTAPLLSTLTSVVPSVGSSSTGVPPNAAPAASIEDTLGAVAAGGPGGEMALLQLQMQMAQESEQFSAVSNVLKTRADTAKGAINNIR